MPLRRASPTIFRKAESRTLIVVGREPSMPARHSISCALERSSIASSLYGISIARQGDWAKYDAETNMQDWLDLVYELDLWLRSATTVTCRS
jgi:hypothetical protein